MTSAAPLPRLGSMQLEQLTKFGWLVVDGFLPTSSTPSFDLVNALRQDLTDLRAKGTDYFTIAKIGHDDQIQDANTPFRDIRHSETCPIGRTNPDAENNLPPSAARDELYEILFQLRLDLNDNNTRHLNVDAPSTTYYLNDQLEEVMYAYYPVGGYYRRHVDGEVGTPSEWRQYSFLIYLEEMATTGPLRLYFDSGQDSLPYPELPNFTDVYPSPGKLVIFESSLLPHEVLPTFEERTAIVGWFLAKELKMNGAANGKATRRERGPTACAVTIDDETHTALSRLRDTVPKLKGVLEPKVRNPEHESGLIGNDWGIVMPLAPQSETSSNQARSQYPSTDSRYWNKRVATFHPITGRLSTLSLGGQRLRNLNLANILFGTDVASSTIILKHMTTLDLSNTDITISNGGLDRVLDACDPQVCAQLYLGGNDWSSVQHVERLAAKLSNWKLEILDLRYAQLTPQGLKTLFTKSDNLLVEKLYLEGNSALGDDGARAFVEGMTTVSAEHNGGRKNRLRELFLGQTNIGSSGAEILAEAIPNHFPHLTKLYLEGNHIGAPGARAFRDMLLDASRAGLDGAKSTSVKLEKLYVDNNNIGKQDAIALGAALNSATVVGAGSFFQ